MKINRIALEIDNFDNAAMQEDRTSEVSRILRELANRVEQYGVVNAFEGTHLRDYNGNGVGFCECDWEEEEDADE